MATITKTLKLPFLRLNRVKAIEFDRMAAANLDLANRVLAFPKEERKHLTTADFRDVQLGSPWIHRTIRNVQKSRKAKRFKSMPLEVGPKHWELDKVRKTFSVTFSISRGVKKRIPLDVHQSSHGWWLNEIMEGRAQTDQLVLLKSRRGMWQAVIIASMEVPDATVSGKWIGVDRGQNIPAVVALPDGGRLVFFKAARIKHIRRRCGARRANLMRLGKMRAVKKMANKESLAIAHINHTISKKIVALASRSGCGIRFENLKGIRKSFNQSKEVKSDRGLNLDYWPFHQLEKFCSYKAAVLEIPVEKVPPQFTSKTHHACGRMGVRKGFDFYCPHCKKHEHADGNAARNVGGYVGMFCAVEPSKGAVVMAASAPPHGLDGAALNPVREPVSKGTT